MATPFPRHLQNRYVRRLLPGAAALDELVSALHALLLVTSREDPLFLVHGLELLIEHLHADQALLVTCEGSSLLTQWWLPEGPGAPPGRSETLCRWLIEHPHRTLVLGHLQEGDPWGAQAELKALGVEALVGVALVEAGVTKGLVLLHYHHPRVFNRPELALLAAVASYLSRILEIETLKQTLGELENSLAITRAVVEDSSIQDPASDLPNLRYLDIWLKANLVAASREHDVMTVAEWQMKTEEPESLARLRAVADGIRGGDLLIAKGHGRFLLLLQKTPKALGQILLNRLREKLGAVPMGATLWVSGSDDLRLESVQKRLEAALEESLARSEPELVWRA